jgi:hypothetical protein
MANLIPFDAAGKLPAHLQDFATDGNEFGGGGGGFPVISIKGKVFTINRAGEKTLVTKPGTDDEPAASVEVVILDVGPKGGLYAKTFYAEGYVEGGNAKPTCYSNDGIRPAADSLEKQSNTCALCPQNAVGSGASQQNPKARACRASKMLAVAPAGQINDPMMVRVPGASVIKLSEYGDFLAKRGVKAAGVVTRIGFDYSVAYPALTFKALGYTTPEMAAAVIEQRNSAIVKNIIGEKAVADEIKEEAPPALAAPAAVEVAVPAPTAKPATSAFSTGAADPVLVEAAAPAAKKTTKKTTAAATTAGVDQALGAINFDD